MLTDFFKLNGQCINIPDQAEFERLIYHSTGLTNMVYFPTELKPAVGHPTFKIIDKSFINFSFAKTIIERIIFVNCKFEDCLFFGSTLRDCEFHNCTFKIVNTHKILIESTYINPKVFTKCFKGIDKSNIAVHLFQQLYNNSKQQGQKDFARVAEFHFNKWKDRVTLNKFRNQKPYPISFKIFLKEYALNWVFRWTCGYGLRFRNFAVTFLIFFTTFFIVNFNLWRSYAFEYKDVKIDSFNSESSTFFTNMLYTLDVTTKLFDSQFQPKSDLGMILLSAQSAVAFLLMSALVTILIKKFVK